LCAGTLLIKQQNNLLNEKVKQMSINYLKDVLAELEQEEYFGTVGGQNTYRPSEPGGTPPPPRPPVLPVIPTPPPFFPIWPGC